MLIFISDLHLTDGTLGETIKAGAFRILRERLSDLAYDASWRRLPGGDTVYRPVESMDIILLGDILDPLRSTQWNFEKTGELCHVRPWDDVHSQELADKVQEITRDILQNNAESLNILRSITQANAITIPPASADGKVENVSRDPEDPERVPVNVRMVYMVGNHDWFYHLPGLSYNRIRADIVKAMGLSNPAQKPFPHKPAESSTLAGLFQAHQVFAQHGDVFDSYNFENSRDAPSLGDAVVVELINRFPAEVHKQLGNALPPECLAGLKEIDNVRPNLIVPIWIHSLLKRTVSDKQLAQKVKDIWDDLPMIF